MPKFPKPWYRKTRGLWCLFRNAANDRELGQSRSSQRRSRHIPDDEPRLVREMIGLAEQYGRYGYRRVTALLNQSGWHVNHK